MNKPLF